MRFVDQVAIVSGAGNGIGLATAQLIAREGGIVVAIDCDRETLELAVEGIRVRGGRALARVVNVLNPTEVKDVVRNVVDELGRVDVLVNSVGGSTGVANPGANVAELEFEEWRQLLAFNLDGTFLLCHEVAPHMMRAGRGKVVNVGSIAARGLATLSTVAYAAAKGGIVAFTAKLSRELGPYGIQVNAIAPGVTLSERIRERWNQRSEEARQRELDRIPLRRIAQPEDQARVICFLASADSDFVSGVTIDVTGGL